MICNGYPAPRRGQERVVHRIRLNDEGLAACQIRGMRVIKHTRTRQRTTTASVCVTVVMTLLMSGCSTEANSLLEGTIQQVVDAATIIVSIDGSPTQVTLANVESPVSTTQGHSACLHAEAVKFFREKADAGNTVRLEHQTVEATESNQSLYAVYVDDVSLNESLVAAGLGIADPAAGEGPLLTAIRSAQEQARFDQNGLYSDQVPCTIPGLVMATIGVDCLDAAAAASPTTPSTSSVATSTSGSTSNTSLSQTLSGQAKQMRVDPNASAAELLTFAEAASHVLDAAKALENATSDKSQLIWRALNPSQRDACASAIVAFVDDSERHHSAVLAALAAANKREENAVRVAAEAEAARMAAEAEAARVADEQRRAADAEAARIAEQQQAAEAARVEQQQRDAMEEQDLPSPPDSSQGQSNGGGGAYPGYTGPRCYAPGGKTWKPC